MAENTTISKITISKDNANKLVATVKDGLALVNKGYLAITPDVARLYDTKAYEVLGYKNFDDLCVNEFGMSHGTTVGIRKVFALYGSKSSKDGSYSIPDKYTEFGYTKLLLFATDKKKFDEAGINPIEEFSPKMTIGEMKAHLRNILEDKASNQDANAIDTTATEPENNATEPENNATQPENLDTEPENAIEVTPLMERLEYIDEIKACAKALKDACDKIRPEKLAILDAITANITDFEKEVKKAYK